VDPATLAAGEAGRSELEDGPVLAAETVRRLGCDLRPSHGELGPTPDAITGADRYELSDRWPRPAGP
jgi:hypothetical protein